MSLEKQVNESIQEKNILKSCYVTRDQLAAISQNIMNSFSIIHFNSRSVKKNFDNIDNLLHSCRSNFSVVALSETWMNDSNGDNFELYKLPEYTVYNVNRKHKKGGGTALYIKSDIDHTFIKELSYTIENCFEVVTVQINVKHGQDMVVACLYRPPNVSIKVFLEHLTVYLNKIKSKKMFICGDFNIDLLKSVDDHDTGNFLETMFSYNLYPLIDKPTRIQEMSCMAIDNIFTNILTSDIKSKILIDDTSDHLPVLCIYNNETIKHINGIATVKIRRITEKRIEELISVLSDTNWDDVYGAEDVNVANKKFTSKLVSVSILPQLSKIIEKLFEIRLRRYIDEKVLFYLRDDMAFVKIILLT